MWDDCDFRLTPSTTANAVQSENSNMEQPTRLDVRVGKVYRGAQYWETFC
jgi:hypothetical protein